MSLNPFDNFSFSSGADSLAQKFTTPFKNFLSADERKALLKKAHETNDFKEGLIITPFNRNGKELTLDIVRLAGNSMPHDSLNFGGMQKITKDYYPGNSQPTVQILGSQESDITIKGRFHALKLKQSLDKDFDKDAWRMYPYYLHEQLENLRVNGFLLHLSLGAVWQRYGFIQECQFEMKTLADINYSITFLIVGTEKPKDFIVVNPPAAVPHDKNKALAQKIAKLTSDNFGKAPASLPKSFADQINGAISDVAAAVNLVTGFVDTVVGEVNALKSSIARAQGLIQNARNKISSFQRTVLGRNPEAAKITSTAVTGPLAATSYADDIPKSTRINGAIANASYVTGVASSMVSVTALLAQLATQLQAVIVTVPLARHRVQSGDTLQTIATKYYNDATIWELIYDHNKLTSSILKVGAILEIPRH